jgi:hypothetical protein
MRILNADRLIDQSVWLIGDNHWLYVAARGGVAGYSG